MVSLHRQPGWVCRRAGADAGDRGPLAASKGPYRERGPARLIRMEDPEARNLHARADLGCSRRVGAMLGSQPRPSVSRPRGYRRAACSRAQLGAAPDPAWSRELFDKDALAACLMEGIELELG